jgi:diacylglycerol kinase family enzyme
MPIITITDASNTLAKFTGINNKIPAAIDLYAQEQVIKITMFNAANITH